MEKQNQIEEQNSNVADNTPDYLAEIERLKSNTVDKSQYEKLLEDNKKLIQTVARNDERARANEAAKNNEKIDIAFLDVEMDGINGIEAGKCLRNNNKDIVLFIISTS